MSSSTSQFETGRGIESIASEEPTGSEIIRESRRPSSYTTSPSDIPSTSPISRRDIWLVTVTIGILLPALWFVYTNILQPINDLNNRLKNIEDEKEKNEYLLPILTPTPTVLPDTPTPES